MSVNWTCGGGLALKVHKELSTQQQDIKQPGEKTGKRLGQTLLKGSHMMADGFMKMCSA